MLFRLTFPLTPGEEQTRCHPCVQVRKPRPRKGQQLATGYTAQKAKSLVLSDPCVGTVHTPCLEGMVRKHTGPSRFSGEGYSWSDGRPCPALMLPPGFSGRTQATQCCRVMGDGSLWCGVVTTPPPALSHCPCSSHPAAPSHSGAWFTLVSEPLWALTALGTHHGHRGMRQLKASGNLGFMDVPQRPSQAPSAFVGWSAPHPPAFPVAVPACGPGPFQLHLREKTHFLRKVVMEVGGRGVRWCVQCEIPAGRTHLLLILCFQCPRFLRRAQGRG